MYCFTIHFHIFVLDFGWLISLKLGCKAIYLFRLPYFFIVMPKYNSIDTIPAPVFFEILKSKNYQLLKPKPKEKNLAEVFLSIYDDFFLKSDNEEGKRYLELTKEIAVFEYKIATLKQCLAFYYYNKTTEQMRIDFSIALQKGYGIEIDLSKPFIEEVHRVLSIEIGIIENDLTLSKIEFEQMITKSKSKDFDYYDAIVGIGNVLQGNNLVNTDITLSVYVALEKAAQEKIKRENNKKAA